GRSGSCAWANTSRPWGAWTTSTATAIWSAPARRWKTGCRLVARSDSRPARDDECLAREGSLTVSPRRRTEVNIPEPGKQRLRAWPPETRLRASALAREDSPNAPPPRRTDVSVTELGHE